MNGRLRINSTYIRPRTRNNQLSESYITATRRPINVVKGNVRMAIRDGVGYTDDDCLTHRVVLGERLGVDRVACRVQGQARDAEQKHKPENDEPEVAADGSPLGTCPCGQKPDADDRNEDRGGKTQQASFEAGERQTLADKEVGFPFEEPETGPDTKLRKVVNRLVR